MIRKVYDEASKIFSVSLMMEQLLIKELFHQIVGMSPI